MDESHFLRRAKEGRHRKTILYAFIHSESSKQTKHLKFKKNRTIVASGGLGRGEDWWKWAGMGIGNIMVRRNCSML